MTLAERYNATLLESARLLENADRLAVQNSDLRAQLAAVIKERDEARADLAEKIRAYGALCGDYVTVSGELARLRVAIEPTAEQVKLYAEAAWAPGGGRISIAQILAAIAARAGVKP